MTALCLSVKQPWASLIASGRKTVELRSWKVAYRGPIVIVASKRADRALVERLGDGPRGVALCVVELVDVRPAVSADEANACVAPPPGSFAWVLASPRALPEIPTHGQLNLYRPSKEIERALRSILPS